MWTIVLVGLFSVFFVFFVLYFIVVLLEKSFVKGTKVKAVVEETRVVKEEIPPETVAVIAAVLAQVMGGEYRIVSIKRVNFEDRDFEIWEKTGWRGRRRWSGSSE